MAGRDAERETGGGGPKARRPRGAGATCTICGTALVPGLSLLGQSGWRLGSKTKISKNHLTQPLGNTHDFHFTEKTIQLSPQQQQQWTSKKEFTIGTGLQLNQATTTVSHTVPLRDTQMQTVRQHKQPPPPQKTNQL